MAKMRKKDIMKQATERKISAAARLAFVALLFLGNLALVFLLSYYLQSQAALLFVALQVVGIIVAIRIQGTQGSPSYKMAWTLTVLAVPVAGLILYVLWGGGHQRSQLEINPTPPPAHKDYERSRSLNYIEKLGESFPTWRRSATYLHLHDFLAYKDTIVTYFPDGDSFFGDLLCRLEQAESFIFLEYFILAEGKLWDRIFAILKDRAAHGVEVKIIFDDFGNIRRMSGETLENIQKCGIEAKAFNPVHQYVNRLYFNYRDHRKICCIDGDIAYTGGINIADEYANIVKRFGHWKDSGVSLEGEGAWGLTRMFLHMWEVMDGELQNEYDYYRPHGPAKGEGWCQCFYDGPLNNPENPAEDLYLQMIATAKDFVYITTPYLAIEEAMVQALCIAAGSGVDVRLFMPGIPDHKYTYLAAGAYYDRLLSHGVKIYEYTPGFLHSKLLVADGEAAVVGTVNMDYRSFQLHYECGVALYGMSAVEHILRDIAHVRAQSREILLPQWRKRNVFRRMAESLLRLVNIWM